MKVLSLALFSMLLSALLIGCDVVAKNPVEAASELSVKLVNSIEQGDENDIDAILGQYYDAISGWDLADRVTFFKSFKNTPINTSYDNLSDEMHKAFESSPNNIRMEILYRETRDEAQKHHVW